MKLLIRRCAIIVALLLMGTSVTHMRAAEGPAIVKIVIQNIGPAAASDDLVRANIRTKPGEVYTRSTIDNDIRTLYSTGLFRNVQVTEDRGSDGMTLTYVMQGKPVLTEVVFNGNKKYSRSKLLKKVTSKTGEPVDERKLFSDSQELLKFYQKKGYQKTQVKYVENIDERAGRGTVVFEITEAPKVKIKRVEFVNAKAFPEKKLRKTIKTRKRWMFSWLTGSGVLKDDQFEDDKEKLSDFYRNEGYIDYELKDVKFNQLNPKWETIQLYVNEGRQYKVGAVDFKGNKLFSADEIKKWIAANKKRIDPAKRKKGENQAGLRLTVGQTFTPVGLNKDIEAIKNFYGSRGYIDCRIDAIRMPNPETSTMDLTYQIEEKDKSFIEKIEIRGNTKTKDKVIRRELAVAPGEVFDMVKVNLSKTRLEQLTYFEKVDAQPEPTDVPNRKNLVVGVEEKNTGNFLVGAGFSTIDEVVGFAEVNQGNFDLFKPPYFTGGGQKFRIRVQMGTKRQDYVMSFIEPWFLGRKLALSVDLYHRELNYLSDLYEERQTGARLGLTRALGSDFLIGGVSYTVEDIGIVNVDPTAPALLQLEKGSYLVSKVGTSIAYDTRNSAIQPDHGQRTEFLTEVAGGPFGGERDFYKLELRSSWYFKGLSDGHIIELTGRTGVVDKYGDSPRVPLFDRWFLGGANTLRGYKYHYVGADDTFIAGDGEPLGGGTYWYGSAEYSIPVIDRVRVAAFYDIGNVYKGAYSYNFGEYLHDVGVGLRLNLPIGPLRLDYGIPLNSGLYTGDTGKFQFSVGYTREF
jgi:outer membrane protein insertion porin family